MTNDSSISFPGGFSVLMAVYIGDNSAEFEEAVNSILSNSISPEAVVIVVDGPVKPAVERVLQQLDIINDFINIIRLEKNSGLANALNIGINYIKTDWIVRADADDINLNNRFSSLAKLIFENPEVDLVGSAILEIDHNKKPLCIRRPPILYLDIIKFLRYRSPFNHMSVAYKKEVIVKFGGYENIYLKEDYALWAKLISNGIKCINSKEVLVLARAGNAMYERRGGINYIMSEIELQKKLVKYKISSLPTSFFYGVLRALVFASPSLIRGLIYKKLLRFEKNGLDAN